jgi:hypothetical protein
MMKTEALRLALEALEEIHRGNMTPMAEESWNKAITAIKAALEAKDEPVAWMNAHDVGFKKSEFGNTPTIPLYTTPPQRTWVGLTDEEVTTCHSLAVLSKKHDGTDPSFTTLLHRQIEAKLKEKNK